MIRNRIYRFKQVCRHIVRRRKNLKNSVILSNNCIAGFLYNDYQQQFTSPTINLQIDAIEFLRFIKNIDFYCNLELEEVVSEKNEEIFKAWNSPHPFPVARLFDITVYFQHYHSFDEALAAWNKRQERMKNVLKNRGEVNIVVMTKEFDDNVYREFASLSFDNKLYIYTIGSSRKLPNTFCLELKEGKEWYSYTIFPFFRQYDKFDFSNWLK